MPTDMTGMDALDQKAMGWLCGTNRTLGIVIMVVAVAAGLGLAFIPMDRMTTMAACPRAIGFNGCLVAYAVVVLVFLGGLTVGFGCIGVVLCMYLSQFMVYLGQCFVLCQVCGSAVEANDY